MARRILMVVTSADRLLGGEATGLWLEEYAAPFQIFKQAGYRITTLSLKGGRAPIDPRSGNELVEHPEWSEAAQMLEQLAALDARVQASSFDAIFLPGGHGCMFDLPNNPLLGHLLADFDARGKIVAAVCHGPAAFVGPKRINGMPLVEGRRMTAFTDSEEYAVGLQNEVPFLLESTLRELGAILETAEDFRVHVVRDCNLITGQNPASSAKTARAVIDALGDLTLPDGAGI